MQDHDKAGVAADLVDHFATTMPAAPRELRIAFTGSGSEYFRIWSVNLLLILVTLGLYLPFAKARRINYFYANTLIDGQALAFHGDPWKMFRGFVLLALLTGSYALASKLSPIAGLVAFFVLCAVWPALWRASLQFRLANTSWRGLRFGFRGSLAGAYAAVLPVYLPSTVLVVTAYWLDPEHQPKNASTYLQIFGFVMLLMAAVMPWGLALIKRYQHGGYAYASQQTWTELPVPPFYGLAIRTVGVMLLASMAAGLIGGALLLFGGMGTALLPAGLGQALAAALTLVGMALGYFVLFASMQPYFTARLQDQVWRGTRSESLRFHSSLSFGALAWLSAQNLLLTVLTLGMYRPFAAINTARLRLQAVHLACDDNLDAWVASQQAGEQDASGEAAGDFFGIDMGL